MTTSIVIPVHGKAALTVRCLSWLADHTAGKADIEVIVVDDGSRDETRSVVEAAQGVKLIRHDKPEGFAGACNSGAAAASGRYVVFLNNDTEGHPGWLDALVNFAENTPDVGAVASKLLYPNGTIQHAGMVFQADLVPRHVYRGFEASHPAVSRSRRFRAVTAACVLVPSSVFEEAGGFDAGFANGFEDVDFCLRVLAAGYGVYYCAQSVLTHFEAATRGDDAEAASRNAERFLSRWRGELEPDDWITYLEDGLLSLEPSDVYPLRLAVAPELAVPEIDPVGAFNVLGARARQVFELLRENSALRAGEGRR